MNDQSQKESSTKENLTNSSEEFDLMMAEVVWQKCKGYPIPECFSKEDRLSILERYWTRAMEKE